MSNPKEISPDLSDGPSIFNSKGKKEFSSVELKSHQSSLNSAELSRKAKVYYISNLAKILLKLLRKYAPEDSKTKKARLTAEAKAKAESKDRS